MLTISWSTQAIARADSGDLRADSFEHTLIFDCVSTESHEGTSELTEHSVESGAPISDHKRANPDKVTIEALVTNTPLDAPPASGYGTSTIQATVRQPDENNAAKASVVVFSAGFDRIGDVSDTLRRLRLEATPVTLTTRIRTYENVQVIGVTEPRGAEDGDSLRMTITVRQVRIAQSRTASTPVPQEPRGAAAHNRGAQEGTDQTRRSSALARARDEYERTGDALGAVRAAF